MSLLDIPSTPVALFIDLFIFFSYIVMAGFLLYVGRNITIQKKITLPWIILTIGLLFTSLNVFVEIVGVVAEIYIIPRPVLWYVFNTIGSVSLIGGFASIIAEKQIELGMLKSRQLEIKDIMDYLKERYYRKEISEEDLRKLYADLVGQLAEIEVKIKRLGKEKKGK